LKHVGAKLQDKKVQIVISGAFNNKKRVHFVGIIIVQLSTCTERQQLKLRKTGLRCEKYVYFKVSATNNWCYLFVSTYLKPVFLNFRYFSG
jgi:hypothetical protein